MAKYMLVSFETCPWVQRSAIVLREKNTEFELRHIKADNRPDWFLAISPHKKVPVLSIDDKVSLFESNAINEYLDETIAPRLHPEDPIERAVNRAWTDYVPSFASIVTATAYADTEADYDKAAVPLLCGDPGTIVVVAHAWTNGLHEQPHRLASDGGKSLYTQNARVCRRGRNTARQARRIGDLRQRNDEAFKVIMVMF